MNSWTNPDNPMCTRAQGKFRFGGELFMGHVVGWKPWTHLEDGLRETVAYLKGV